MEKKEVIIKQLDESVLSVVGNGMLQGFQKAHVVADAIVKIKELLTPEYMKPIMALQGNRLGFKTDKDKNGGYSADIVKNCVIEAVLNGLQPTGNQFNIIAGNMYITKEGCGYILNQIKPLKWELICGLPKINNEKTSAAVDVTVKWSMGAEAQKTATIPIPIKMDSYTSVDAIIGKATRKGRAWLIGTVTGVEVPEGDITDISYTNITPGIDPDELQFLFENKKELLEPNVVIDIERILKNKEVNSYKKVKTLLDSIG